MKCFSSKFIVQENIDKSMFAVNQVERIWERSEQKIYEERLRYEEIYELIENYMVGANKRPVSKDRNDPRIIIGGSMGVNLLLGKERTYQDFVYELYTEDALHHANSLSNEIAALIKSKCDDQWITRMQSRIPNVQYEISIDFRPMVRIFTLKSDPVKAYELIQPVKVKSYDGKKELLALSPEMHLIDVYQTLSSPNQVGEWEETLQEELKLFKLLETRISKIGGADVLSKEERTNIENVLLSKFVAGNENVVLVGEHAFKILYKKLNKNLQTSSPVIRVISSLDPDEDYKTVKKLITQTLGRDVPVTSLTRSVNVMQDHRLLRTTIKVGPEGNQKEVLYIYNAAQYDLIPYNTVAAEKSDVNIKLANPFVLIRFLLIDLWVMRWVKEMGKVNDFFANKRINNIISMIIDIRKAMGDQNKQIKDEYFSKQDHVLNVFQRNRYIGKYIDELISQKLSMKDQRRYADYFPQGFLRKNGEYRRL
jgi:hypothetical protein